MQQPPALRSIYGASQPKTKHAAAVSPILDPDEENPSLSGSDDDDASLATTQRRTASSNNWSTHANVNRVPQDDDGVDQEAAGGVVLQKKSAQYEIPRLAVRIGGGVALHSNQDLDSSSSQKYRVLGQKQQWRKNRSSQRARDLPSTITPVDDTSVNSGPSGGDELDDDDVDLENPRFSVHESFDPPSNESEHSSLADSEVSTGRGSSFSSSNSSAMTSSRGDEKQRFVVTQQEKSKFAARIHLPGQNPLYLGRYKTEVAALAACESAYSVITTPRK